MIANRKAGLPEVYCVVDSCVEKEELLSFFVEDYDDSSDFPWKITLYNKGYDPEFEELLLTVPFDLYVRRTLIKGEKDYHVWYHYSNCKIAIMNKEGTISDQFTNDFETTIWSTERMLLNKRPDVIDKKSQD